MKVSARGHLLASLGARSVEIPLDGDGPPREFRLFKAGENETTKGVFLFDDKAARAVMARASEHGVDLMVDLEHLSLDTESRSFDPDARAWLQLEVRGGELWAVNVRWTEDGVRRLKERTQRYVSPAFLTDDDNRVIEIVNIALTAMPATHGTPALVAANRRQKPMSLKDRINALSARLSIGKAKLQKLADGEGEAPAGKFATAKKAADDAAQALADFDKAASGNDVDATFAAMEAAVKACDAFEGAVAAIAGGSSADADPAPAPDAAAKLAECEPKKEGEKEMAARREAELISLRAELKKRDHDAQVAKLAAEMDERRTICAALVRDRGLRPADVWADPASGTTPKNGFASMPIAELRDLGKALGATITLGGPRAPSGSTEVPMSSTLTEDEVLYVKARHGALIASGQKLRTLDDTLLRYGRIKEKQLKGAEEKGDRDTAKRLTSPLERGVLALAHRAGLITLASTPVTPFEEFGASSQIALQNFRLEYNLALASIQAGWAETVGRMLADGSMKTTYPLNFRALRYVEKTAQNAATGQPMNADISVQQREFYEGQEIELRRLTKGDFAYIQSWAQLASDLARARIFLRDELVTTLLEAGTTGYWGSSATMATGIDGQPFFSATHKVNPFDATRKLRGSATFSNYQSGATPVTANNLIAEKNAALQVAAPDGRELGVVFDGILYPSALEQTVYNLLKVQDLILDAKATLASVNNVMGATRNPHFNSGLEMTRAQQLAGTDTTANYYLYSREAIARGVVPWIIAEDPTEEVRLFDESSDFYKTTGHIKYESHVYLNAALLYPHAIRYIKGS